MADAMEVLKFFKHVGQLKREVRTGWIRYDVVQPESVAEHMYMMGVMSMLLDEDGGLDKTHCMKMALVHDLAECIVGDITPYCGVSKEEKHRREEEAMIKIIALIQEKMPKVSSEIMDLWKEYNSQSTAEAKAVKDLDRFEMILQAVTYEKEGNRHSNDLQEFFDTTKGKFTTQSVKEWVDALEVERKTFHDARDLAHSEDVQE